MKRIGEILLENNFISLDALNEAILNQKESGKKLGEILVEMGYLTEENLLKGYAIQTGSKPISENDLYQASKEVTKLIPEDFAKEKNVLAISKSDGAILVAMYDPEDMPTIDAIKKLTSLEVDIAVASKKLLTEAIDKIYSKIRQFGEVESAISNIDDSSGAVQDNQERLVLGSEKVSSEDAPFVKIVNLILEEAIKEDSSDIHIEPSKDEVSVRIRIDGVLVKIMSPPINSLNGIVSRLKILSKLDIAEKRLPQDGRMKIETSEREIDVRVSILPTVHGEKVVLRLLGSGKLSLNLSNLGFSDKKLSVFKKWIKQPYGMIIISGPTGSGKSTTLYAALKEIHSEGINITTVEDPVEYQLQGINQVQMHDEIGLNFSGALRSILRQDPDVLLIGEIRDEETADIAVKFSLTGHLVFSTVHANDAPSTIARLLDLGIPPFLLGSCLNLVMAQRLVRTIDEDSKESYKPTNEELDLLSIPSASRSSDFYRGIPNQNNHNTGYKGRTAIHEILEVNTNMKQLIFEDANQNQIKEAAKKSGMTTLREAGIDKILSGKTDINEVLRATVED
tara:strand:- start:1381 stop:3078 length:1698 start_codon:yes stop_codon:yes gene_type:complete